jgi:hypothetical protein
LDPLNEQLEDARLLGGKQFIPEFVEVDECYSACNFDPLSWGIGVQN